MSFVIGTGGASAPPPPNSLQFALQSGMLTLTTAFQDMPGLSLTLSTAGVYLVTCSVDAVIQAGDEATTILAQLLVSGSAQPNNAILSAPTALTRATIAQQWKVQTAGSGLIKLQSRKTAGTGASNVTTHSSLTALWVSP